MNALFTLLLAANAAAAPVTGLEYESRPQFGDLDAMLERRVVRVVVPYSRTLYFNDRGRQRGLTADTLRDFEIFLNKKFPKKVKPIVVVALPTSRDRLLSGVLEGRADIAAGNLTITPERDTKVAFSKPLAEGPGEIVVTGPRSPKLAKLEDLGGHAVHVRQSSSYYANLVALNRDLSSRGLPAVSIVIVPEVLEDEDLMDMVAAGLMELTVVDAWKADIWARMQKRLKPRKDLALTASQSVGWAFRSGSPKLAGLVDEFIDKYPGMRAQRLRNYPAYVPTLGNATHDADWKRYQSTIVLFRKYAPRYGFDPLLVAALGYQESRLDQSARSSVGAIGVMQLMPDTGKTLGVGDITHLEPNVHGGIKYLRILRDRAISGGSPDEQNLTLFALAAYNCGPGRVAALRAEAPKMGLDPDIWFDNVERVAARRVGQETVLFVRSIYKYYAAYKLQDETLAARTAATSVYAPPPKKAAKKAAARKPAASKE
ncbi:MAG: lytic transglycosylase F [Betaproteobacteria bacterium]|nr:lytic transglycosylase F [Betaproteobacteria bacterium]